MTSPHKSSIHADFMEPDIITEDLVNELATRKPLRAVFRDSSYESDSTKINVTQIFKLLSPETEVKCL